MLISFDLGLEPGDQVSRVAPGMSSRAFFRAGRNEDYVSKTLERWKELKELATLRLGEQGPARLTELASAVTGVAICPQCVIPRQPLRWKNRDDEDDNHSRAL